MNNSDPVDPTQVFLEASRFWVQKVFVPLLVCIGVFGNTIAVVVLTRRRMRSSTNIYLSALAIADIIHLIFVFLLSFSNYSNIHDRKYELYWRFFGLTHWLCDAASSTSVWLTVSFTLERYIAVCHPIKGKVLCTENRAKSIIALVYIFCTLTTASTNFEYQMSFNDTCLKNCTAQDLKKMQTGNVNRNGSIFFHYLDSNGTIMKPQHAPIHPETLKAYNDIFLKNFKNIIANCSSHNHIIYVPIPMINMTEKVNYTNIIEDQWAGRNLSEKHLEETNGTTCCLQDFRVGVESTALGSNKTYTTFIYWYSAIFFALLPLAIIATFNCFLVRAVHKSRSQRRVMTNSQESYSNENRITMMLIGVVILFLVCQTPTASFLIYKEFHKSDDPRTTNILLALGNIFNLMLTINAACNFLFYCVMSKKFRSTFKKLFFERRKKQQDTVALSFSKRSNSQKFNPYKHGIRRNASEYHTPRNLETQSLTSIPRSKSLMVRQLGKTKSTDLIV